MRTSLMDLQVPASLYQSASVNTKLKISHDTYAAARNAAYTFPSPLYVSLIAACVDFSDTYMIMQKA